MLIISGSLDTPLDIPGEQENNGPVNKIHNYQSVAEYLPIFCVSSSAYQLIRGWAADDSIDEGLEDEEATEIPQLIRHAMNLTKIRRIQHSRKFLNGTLVLLNSLRIWGCDQTESKRRMERQAQLAMIENAQINLEMVLLISSVYIISSELTGIKLESYREIIHHILPSVVCELDLEEGRGSSGKAASSDDIHSITMAAKP